MGWLIIYGGGRLPRQFALGGGGLGHIRPSPQLPIGPGCDGVTLPQVIALVGALVLQLAGQAGHQGSELHRLQGHPDVLVRVLV